MRDRRRFSRVPFDARARAVLGGEAVVSTLVDISINGALILVPPGSPVKLGAEGGLDLLLDDGTTRVSMEVRVAHVSERGVGLECTALDLESASHLRRLLALNLGDSKLANRELAALLAARA